MINYKNKYLKYKFKYLKLIQQGGMFITPTHSAYWDYVIDRFGNNNFLNDLEPAQLLKLIIKEYKNYPDILEPYIISNKERLNIYISELSYDGLHQLIHNNIESYLNNNLIEFEQIEEIINNTSDLKNIKDIGEDAHGLLFAILILSYNNEIISKTLFDLYKIYHTILNINNICELLFLHLNLILIEKYEKDMKIKRGISYTNVNYFIQVCHNNYFNDFKKIKEYIELPQLLFFQILNDNDKKNDIIDYFKKNEGRYLDFLKVYPELYDILSKTNFDYTYTLFYQNLITSLEKDNIELFKQMFYEIKYVPNETYLKNDGMYRANAFTEKTYSKHPFIVYIYDMIEQNQVNLESIKNLDIYKDIESEGAEWFSKISLKEILISVIIPEVSSLIYPDFLSEIDDYLNILFLLYKNLHNREEHINNLINTIQTAVSYDYITFDLE